MSTKRAFKNRVLVCETGGLEGGKEYGKNVSLRDIYYRHNEKVPTEIPKEGELDARIADTDLTAAGFEEAEEVGQDLRKEGKGPKIYYTSKPRSESFARGVEKGSRTPYKMRLRKEIGIEEMTQSREFGKEWKQRIETLGREATIQWYLDFDKERPDLETASPYEKACAFASHVLRHSKIPEKRPAGTKDTLLNSTHGGAMEPFLYYALGEEIEKEPVNPEGKFFVERMGGAFEEKGKFECLTHIDGQGKKSMVVELRGKSYRFPEGRLEEMAEEHMKRLKKQKNEGK